MKKKNFKDKKLRDQVWEKTGWGKVASWYENTISAEISKNKVGNFNDLINSYRITKAKQLLKSSNYNDYTIDAVGLECGFNSKSTFYSAFKKVTNTTPAAFKRS